MSEQEREALPPLPTAWLRVKDADGIEVPVFRAFQMRDYARAALAAKAVPARWKLVPVDPTPKMWAAARAVPEPVKPYPMHYALVWDAMLAATPPAPAQAAPRKPVDIRAVFLAGRRSYATRCVPMNSDEEAWREYMDDNDIKEQP